MGFLPGLIIFGEEAVEVANEGEIGDGGEHLFFGAVDFLDFGDVDVLTMGIVEDAGDHRGNVLMDRQNVFVDD